MLLRLRRARLFKDEEYEDAALTLYSVLQNDPNPDNRDQAIIYLGETLVRMDLLVPGMFYFRDIFEVGRANRYYLNAIEGLMTVQEKLHDSLLVPSLFNNNLDPKGFGQLDSGRIAKVNFMIGELMYRQNKRRQAKATSARWVPRIDSSGQKRNTFRSSCRTRKA